MISGKCQIQTCPGGAKQIDAAGGTAISKIAYMYWLTEKEDG